MTLFAVWVLGVAVADLLAGPGGEPAGRGRGALAVGGAAVAAWLTGRLLGGGWDAVAAAALVAVTAAGWLVARTAVRPRAAAGAVAVAALLAAALLADAVVDAGPRMPGAVWPEPDPGRGLTPSAAVLLTGVMLSLVGTANVVVRLLLRLADTDATAAGTRLRGGRVIGPLERLMLFGLGLAGAWTAAGLVVAAKSLLRLSELRAGGDPPGPPRSRDERAEVLSEYVLLGSLASWALALAAVAVIRLVPA